MGAVLSPPSHHIYIRRVVFLLRVTIPPALLMCVCMHVSKCVCVLCGSHYQSSTPESHGVVSEIGYNANHGS